MLQDIELLDSGNILKGLRFPHKIKKVTQIVITAGQLSCLVDFRMWSLKAPAVALFLPGQVVESIDLDNDFSGFGMVMNQPDNPYREEIIRHLFSAHYYICMIKTYIRNEEAHIH